MGRKVKLPGIEGVFCPSDTRELVEHSTDAASPIQRYGMKLLSDRPIRNGAIYQRHSLFPYAVVLSAEGALRLAEDQTADTFPLVPHLSKGEFLGLQCARWACAKAPDVTPTWHREIGLVTYKIERARNAKKKDLEEALRDLKATLQKANEGGYALRAKQILGSTNH